MPSKNKFIYILFFIFLIIFVIIVAKGLSAPQPGDENVYFYMGKLITDGKLPYKDFFYAHPPFHIYLIAIVYRIFGFNVAILKSISLISMLVSAFFIFKISKHKFGNFEAIISSFLFLFTYNILFNSVFSFGLEVSLFFLFIGVYFLLNKDNYIAAGLLFGLAAVTRLLVLIPILVILISVMFKNKKNFVKISSIFLLIFVLVNGMFSLFYGSDYITPVYKFHLLKNYGMQSNFREYFDNIKLNWIIISSALLCIFLKSKKGISMFITISIAYLAFLMFLKKIFGFYFVVVMPFLALIGGYCIAHFCRKFNFKRKLNIIIAIILSIILLWDITSNVLFLEMIGFNGFERGNDIINFINLNSNNKTLLFGDSSVVPLLALLTNKEIALNFVDTNDQVFSSGVKDLDLTLSDLKGKDILFIVRSNEGIGYFDILRNFLNEKCDFLSKFHDRIEGNYFIYRCIT